MKSLSPEQYRELGVKLRQRVAQRIRSIADAVEAGDVCEIRKHLGLSPKGDCDAKRVGIECTNCLPGSNNHFIVFNSLVHEALAPHSAVEEFCNRNCASSWAYDLYGITALIEFFEWGGRDMRRLDDGSIATLRYRDCQGYFKEYMNSGPTNQ